tara:strand:+ start:123 stop:320 length:198 start_codon:yes stop_codon:yes gene_type:complete
VIPVLASINVYWFVLPLVIIISLVFSATRHEHWKPIVSGAIRTGTWLLVFLAIFFLLLFVISWWN